MHNTNKEVKFVFPDRSTACGVFEMLGSNRELGAFRLSHERDLDFTDHYYDTECRGLTRSRSSLRIRKINDEAPFLQFKKPMGDIAVNMGYMILSWDHNDSIKEYKNLSLSGEARTALLLHTGTDNVSLIGIINVKRKIMKVFMGDQCIGKLTLDSFMVSESESSEKLYGSEIEIKGDDPRDLMYLGQCLCNWFGMVKVTTSKVERYLPQDKPSKRLIMDMDPGVDDALALLYVLTSPDSPKLEAITTVGGNVSVEQCARNASRICQWALQKGYINEIPPIGTGIELSQDHSDASNVHGSDGLGDIQWGDIDNIIKDHKYLDAIDLQRDILNKYQNEITIIGTGPCSNLAKLIEIYPDALSKARDIILMGGSFFDCGNRGPKAEFNIHSDSRSAKKVLEYCRKIRHDDGYSYKEQVQLSFVGLDITHRTILNRSAISEISSPVAELSSRFSAKYMTFYRNVMGVDGCPLHDPLAAGLALHPELFVREAYHVEIVSTPDYPETDGISIADYRPCALFKDRLKETTRVCVSVNSGKFLEYFLNCFKQKP